MKDINVTNFEVVPKPKDPNNSKRKCVADVASTEEYCKSTKVHPDTPYEGCAD